MNRNGLNVGQASSLPRRRSRRKGSHSAPTDPLAGQAGCLPYLAPHGQPHLETVLVRLIGFREGEADEFERRVSIHAFEFADKMGRMVETQFVGDGLDMLYCEEQVRSVAESLFI